MANTAYPLGLDKFVSGQISWTSDTIKLAAVDSTYTYSAVHEFYDAVSPSTLGTVQTITGRAVLTGGVLDGDSVNYPGVILGETVTGLVIYKDTGNTATSPLLFFMDTNDDGTTISRAGDGSTIVVLWSSTAQRIVDFG